MTAPATLTADMILQMNKPVDLSVPSVHSITSVTESPAGITTGVEGLTSRAPAGRLAAVRRRDAVARERR